MRFQVPQFIEIEDTIFGPLTFKQFLYLGGSGGLAFLFYVFLPLWLAIVPIIAVAGLGFALAFYKVNERPFINIIESAVYYYSNPKLYVWKKQEKIKKPTKTKTNEGENQAIVDTPTLSASKLKDLTWSLDVKEHLD